MDMLALLCLLLLPSFLPRCALLLYSTTGVAQYRLEQDWNMGSIADCPCSRR